MIQSRFIQLPSCSFNMYVSNVIVIETRYKHDHDFQFVIFMIYKFQHHIKKKKVLNAVLKNDAPKKWHIYILVQNICDLHTVIYISKADTEYCNTKNSNRNCCCACLQRLFLFRRSGRVFLADLVYVCRLLLYNTNISTWK